MLRFCILFSTAFHAEVAAKPLILDISVLTSFTFVLKIVLAAKLVISSISSSIFLIWALYPVFLTNLFFITLVILLKSAGTGTNLSMPNWSTLLFKLLKLFGKLFNLLIFNWSTSDFELAKFNFSAKLEVSI